MLKDAVTATTQKIVSGPSNAKIIASITPPYIANPPNSGIGLRCTLRGPGKSTIPTRNANARTGTVSTIDAKRAMRNASTPADMQPRRNLADAPVAGGTAHRYPQIAGFGGPSSQETPPPLPHAA